MSEEFYTLLNQTLRKPNVNSTGLGIYYNTPFLYGEAERNKLKIWIESGASINN